MFQLPLGTFRSLFNASLSGSSAYTISTPTVNAVMKVRGLENLPCAVHEVIENQEYNVPQNPLDNGTFIADTIYRLPKKLTVRVLVKEEDIPNFINTIYNIQFSNEVFTVVSIANEVFHNLKITGYQKEVNNKMLGKQFYLLAMEEIRLVQALVQSYKSNSKAGYSKPQQTGNKEAEPRKTNLIQASNYFGGNK